MSWAEKAQHIIETIKKYKADNDGWKQAKKNVSTYNNLMYLSNSNYAKIYSCILSDIISLIPYLGMLQ